MSYAAYRVLLWRYGTVSDLATAQGELDATMARSATGPNSRRPRATTPAALGNRIAAAVLEYGRTDGALEDERYKDPAYTPANDPLEVAKPGTTMNDPNRWQPLALDGADLTERPAHPGPGPVVHRAALGPRDGASPWRRPSTGTPIDPGPPPRLGDAATDQAFKDEAVDVIRRSHLLDADERRHHRHRPGRLRRQRARDQRRGWPRCEPRDGPAVRAARRAAGRLRAAPWPSTGRTDRSRRRHPATGTSIANEVAGQRRAWSSHRWPGRAGRSPRVGREAVPRAQRRGPRRGDRDLGRKGLLRLGPPDLA